MNHFLLSGNLQKNHLNAMILEMDSGSGLLSTAIKNIWIYVTSLTSKSKTLGDTFFRSEENQWEI